MIIVIIFLYHRTHAQGLFITSRPLEGTQEDLSSNGAWFKTTNKNMLDVFSILPLLIINIHYFDIERHV